MERGGFDFAQAPPLAVPLRFLLSAPLFGVAAALMLLLYGPSVVAHRWTPQALGTTHLITLGFLTMAMCGALFQLLPVLTGWAFPRAGPLAAAGHVLLSLGTLCLSVGLLVSSRGLLWTGAVVLAPVLTGIVIGAAVPLLRSRSRNPTVVAIGLSVAALMVALVLGLALAGSQAWHGGPRLRLLTDAHLAWAAVGWVPLLLMGVAYQVVPMFQMTPEYPRPLALYLAPVLFVGLVASTASGLAAAGTAGPWALCSQLTGFVVVVALALFAVVTLRLQARRRRRLRDATLDYWRLGMFGLLGCVVLWGYAQLSPRLAQDPRYAMLLGSLYLTGFVVPVMSGMLYKIVPFLVWLNLHARRLREGRGESVRHLPGMRQVIPDHRSRQQFRVYVLGLALLGVGVAWPGWMTRAAGAVLAVAVSMLWLDLLRGALLYRRLESGT